MIRPNVARWNQSVEELRELSLNAPHPRTRERFQALFMVASKQSNATDWARHNDRNDETVLKWIHSYNDSGPEALSYRRTGGAPPFFSPAEEAQILETINQSTPHDHGLPGYGWNLKKLREWFSQLFGRTVSRGALRRVLKEADLSWKKCKKFLGKAKSQKRAEHMEKFLALLEEVRRGEVQLLFLDESHFHRDLESGHTWGPIGKRLWRKSDCPRLDERINWYGAYNYTLGQCFLWNEGACNKEHTCEFLAQVAEWLASVRKPGQRVVIVWDGAPWHIANIVKEKAAALGIELVRLPGYSPDLNPIERLWSWMRQEVTQHLCHPTLQALFDDCKAFVDRINQDAVAVIDRLWPKTELDPEFEKLLVSE